MAATRLQSPPGPSLFACDGGCSWDFFQSPLKILQWQGQLIFLMLYTNDV